MAFLRTVIFVLRWIWEEEKNKFLNPLQIQFQRLENLSIWTTREVNLLNIEEQ